MNTPSPALPSDLKPRTISGIVLITITAVDLYLGGSFFVAFVAALTIGIIWESFDLLRFSGIVQRVLATSLSGTAILTLMPDLPNGGFSIWVAVSMMVVGLLIVALAVVPRGGAAALARMVVLALLNLGCLLIALAELREGVFLVLLIPAVIGTDIGAYFTGRLLGGPKLAPRISPNKTWSGAIGGVVAAVVMGTVGLLVITGDPAFVYIPVLAVLSVCSQIGDLTESWLKRRAGIKDSGHLIPGHGGFLDRFDGFLGASVLVLGPWYLLTELGMVAP